MEELLTKRENNKSMYYVKGVPSVAVILYLPLKCLYVRGGQIILLLYREGYPWQRNFVKNQNMLEKLTRIDEMMGCFFIHFPGHRISQRDLTNQKHQFLSMGKRYRRKIYVNI